MSNVHLVTGEASKVSNFPRPLREATGNEGEKTYWFSQLQSASVCSFTALLFSMEFGERGIFVNLSELCLEYLREKSSTEFRIGGRKFVLVDVWPPASMFPSLDFGF